MRLFNSAPLVIWTSIFIIGLILGVYSNYWTFLVGLLFICVVGIFQLFNIFTLRSYLFFASLILILGFVRMSNVFPTFSANQMDNQEAFFIVKVEEQLRIGDVWATNLVHVEKMQSNKNWKTVDQDVVMICETSVRNLEVGDRVLVKSTLNKIENKGNSGEFDASFYWLSKGVRYQCFGFSEEMYLLDTEEPGFWNQLLISVRTYSTKMIDRFVGGEQGDLVKAILLGDKSNLDTETKSSFANAGAMHVLAVSGLHVGIIAYLLSNLFQLLFSKVNRKRAVILLILLLWFYAFITGFSASVSRAVFMYSVLIGAQLLERNYSSLNTLSFTALILLVWNPLYLFDIGFQLSFLAMIGIFTIYPLLQHRFYIRNKLLKWLWQGTAVGLAAQVFTIPISIYYFHQFPNYFILSNIAVMVLAGIILGIGIALLMLGKIPLLNVAIGWVLYFSISLLLLTITWIDQLPGSIAVGFNPSFFWVIISYIVILTLLIFARRINLLVVVLCAFPLLFLLQFERFENLNQQELCIFNSSYPIMLLNNNQEQICFYAGKERGLKEAQFLMKDYQKIFPGTVRFESINRKKMHLENHSITINIDQHPFFIDCKINKEHITIVTSMKFLESRDVKHESTIVTMRYLNRKDGVDYQLINGDWKCRLGD